MKTAVGIVSHPSRSDTARRLAHDVRADVTVCDAEGRGERWCHQEVMRLAVWSTEWLVLLEDDALPCPRFRERLDERLAEAGEAIVSLYLGTGRWAGTSPRRHERVIREAIGRTEAAGGRWIESDALWHAVGFAVRCRDVDSLLAHLESDPRPTDHAVTRWARRHSVPVRYTWPSLIDHDDTLPRIVRTSDRPVPRRAWRVEV